MGNGEANGDGDGEGKTVVTGATAGATASWAPPPPENIVPIQDTVFTIPVPRLAIICGSTEAQI